MTIRFGDQVRLVSRDRFRLMLLIERDPGDIVCPSPSCRP